MSEDAGITLEELLRLRRATQVVADATRAELQGHLDTLAPLLRPKLLLGDFIAGESSEARPQAEAGYRELCERFASVAQRPFRQSPNLPKPLPAIRVRLELHPLEEPVSVAGKSLTVVYPFAWAFTYPGACSLGELRAMLSGAEERKDDEIRQFLLHCCILSMQLERAPKAVELLGALRYQLGTETLVGLGELRVPVVRSAILSTRPGAQVMADAADMAGQSTFSEVIALERARALEDPLQRRLEEALAAQGL